MRFRIRVAESGDIPAIRQLVADVVAETYGDLLGDVPPPQRDWGEALVAELDGNLVAVALTEDQWLSDLWITAGVRRQGVGTALLAAAEARIAEHCWQSACLRVVAENSSARRFYETRGWTETHRFQHETLGVEMVEMTKTVIA